MQTIKKNRNENQFVIKARQIYYVSVDDVLLIISEEFRGRGFSDPLSASPNMHLKRQLCLLLNPKSLLRKASANSDSDEKEGATSYLKSSHLAIVDEHFNI